MDVHGDRIQEEEREIAMCGIKEYTTILDKQVKSSYILQRFVFIV
jgi:hypothetical protein